MNQSTKQLGVLRPIGGGDPIPLAREEVIIGRRPTNDIQLDFENISGKHCVLKYIRGVWHVRDLGSTNGTFVNRQRVDHDHGVMPDDELRIATHSYTIDYEPVAPSSLIDANHVLEEEIAEAARAISLTELAGIETEPDSRPRWTRPKRGADREAAPRAEPAAFHDSIPTDFETRAAEPAGANDEDFFDLIKGDLEKQRKPKRP